MSDASMSDVLLDAAEYLRKLGNNLKIRSESLKEKRIRKDKLKNVHSVQKAASKILVICELSKKSLENVEVGVKKIIDVCNANSSNQRTKSQDASVTDAASEGNSHQESTSAQSTSMKHPSKPAERGFKHYRLGKQNILVPNEVPLKHYLSCKVLATQMSSSMLEKYPIYFDCELYRKRKNKPKKIDRTENIEIIQERLIHGHTKPKDHKEKKKKKYKHLKIFDDNSSVSGNEDASEKNVKDKILEPKQDLNKSSNFEKDVQNDDKVYLNNTNNVEDVNNVLPLSSNAHEQKNNIDFDKATELNSEQRGKYLSSEKDTLKVSDEKNKCSNSKASNLCVPSSDHSNDSLTAHHVEITKDGSEESKNSNSETSQDGVKQYKPILKCVNIQKLLKPSLVQNSLPETPKPECELIKSDISKRKLITWKVQLNRKLTKPQHKKSSTVKLDKNFDIEEQYWKEKRKEVKAFKPKKFTINLSQLPTTKFTHEFMTNNGIKKITENNVVLVEIDNKIADNAENGLVSEPTEDDTETFSIREHLTTNKQNFDVDTLPDTSTDINTIKNALLNDSDSNKNENDPIPPPSQLVNETEESKKSVNNSDNNKKEENDQNTQDKTNEIETPDLNPNKEDGDQSIQNKERDHSSNSKAEDDMIKSSLLNDSSDSLEKIPVLKRKQCTEELAPKAKRKHLMDSMHAKKMLLTYSSSSDTEDEQLKSALKDIKVDLIKDKLASEAHKQRLLDSSSSDLDKRVDAIPSDKKKKKFKKISHRRKSSKVLKSDGEESKVDTGGSKTSSISQVDGNMDDQSCTSDEQMGRSRVKAGGSKQTSESQDGLDKEIDGLTNLKSLKKSRRRHNSTSSNKSMDTNSTEVTKQPKKGVSPLNIIEEDILGAASDNEISDAESGNTEELPSVMVSDLNGGSIDHLARDELLDDSGASSSNTDKDEHSEKSESKNEGDSDSEAVTLKRRKANAIFSDSEGGGSSRKKEREVDERDSDFEDSGDESSELSKKNKRKKKVESDASGSSSGDEISQKKRRRIKALKDSDGSGSESETEGKKHGRKNIRKVMGKDQLEEATKKAAREEKERIARIADRQKLYNNLAFDESGKPDEVVLDKVVLDFDPDTKEPLIEVDRGLVKKLKPHQANGIKFMFDACFETVKRMKKDKGSGCILAHCMGLGKTLQVVSLTHALLTHSKLTGVHRVLVVCPLSTVLNWVNEYRMWLKFAQNDMEIDIYELSRYKQNSERAFQLQEWLENGGVCVLGYEMFRNLSSDTNKKFRKKMLKSFQDSLVDPGPDLVVCDEGHLLKNEKTSLSQSMNRVRTLRRIVLTGTPLQNNLKEYYCMVQFVKPNLLGKYNEYLNRFVNPITNGQYTDSTEQDIRVMKRRSHVLHKMLDGSVQRRDYGVLAPFLPPKHEYVLFITLTDLQTKLYQFYLDNYSRRPQPGKSSGFLFPDFQSLQRIWTHPLVLKYNSERYEIMQQKKREREEEDSEGSLADFIDDDTSSLESTTEESSEDMSDVSDDSRKKSKKKKALKKKKDAKSSRRGTRANPLDAGEDEERRLSDVEEIKNDNPTEWWIPLVSDEELDDLRNSHKLVLLFDILRQCEAIGDKVLVFSQSLYSLDLIEHFLGKVDEATQEGRVDEKLGGHVGSWSPGIDYFRLDGSTSCENRSIWCKNFNREDNPRARLFLISTRAGGLGINLVAANRVVIFDVSWNPSHDVQSIFRVYRFGQKKPCYVYRFLAMGTMEEKIYERQVTKQAISKRVIDEQQIDRHYAENDLAELYKFEPTPVEPRPLPSLPKDRLFAEMLKEHDKQIYKYHEHDSLLENKEEETLTEEERKAAWEDFENEKNRPPPVPFNAWPMHNGMAGMMAQQQQQQLVYTTLATMLRKDYPNLSDQQLASMLPLIYNANPAMFGGYDFGLMQKMTDMYKYSQPGMMNAMMNPSLNAGTAMGGTSGLQYEPPWQRQQQQQQQMRLQQLMQQQNMGAKYYAGGLGSRDPSAMMLQQQRARELMLGEVGRGRPRGRPPLQARPPPTNTGDVVDLDSD